jgi:hypothetical protein
MVAMRGSVRLTPTMATFLITTMAMYEVTGSTLGTFLINSTSKYLDRKER